MRPMLETQANIQLLLGNQQHILNHIVNNGAGQPSGANQESGAATQGGSTAADHQMGWDDDFEEYLLQGQHQA